MPELDLDARIELKYGVKIRFELMNADDILVWLFMARYSLLTLTYLLSITANQFYSKQSIFIASMKIGRHLLQKILIKAQMHRFLEPVLCPLLQQYQFEESPSDTN